MVQDARVEIRMRMIEDQVFLWLVVLTTIAFGMIIWPYFGAILWGAVAAIVFAPVYRRVLYLTRRRAGLAATITLLMVLLLVILPLMLIASSLVLEANSLYQSVEAGEVTEYLRNVGATLPGWVHDLLEGFDLTTFDELRERLSRMFAQFLQLVASRAVTIGQSTFGFIVALGVMLYLMFFLLRDGASLTRRLKEAVPLRPSQRDQLFERFVTVVRATVKGTVLVAALQGTLGGMIFWMLGIKAPVLWGVTMAIFSLLPAVGASIVWLPVAIYLILAGMLGKAIILVLFGVLVIGMIDNLLRPILVGQATRIPDYVILISTLGGISLTGLNGFVLGPMVAAMFITVWSIFTANRQESEDSVARPDKAAREKAG